MGYTSQQGQVGFAIQSSKGSPLAATRFGRMRGGSLAPKRDLLIPDPEIGGNRDVPQAYLGPISYAGSYEFYARSQMIAMLLYGALGAPTSSNVAGTDEVQTITVNGSPTGGTFTLTYRGQTTSAIAFDANSAAVDAALEALSTIPAGGVTVAGDGPHVVTFAGALAASNTWPITANGALLTGGTSPTVTVAITTPGYDARGTHVFVPSDLASLPWLSVEERLSFDLESYRYTDAKVSSLRIEADAEGYMMGKSDLIALTQVAGFTAQTAPPVDTSPMFLGSQVTVYWNGAALPAKSFNFEITNAMEDNDFRLGSYTLGDITEKRRMFKLGTTVRPSNANLWREATYGGSALTGPRGGRASYGTLSLVCTTFEDIQGAVTPWQIRLDAPGAAMAPFAFDPKGDDVIETAVDFTVIREDNLAPAMTVTVINNLAAVS